MIVTFQFHYGWIEKLSKNAKLYNRMIEIMQEVLLLFCLIITNIITGELNRINVSQNFKSSRKMPKTM